MALTSLRLDVTFDRELHMLRAICALFGRRVRAKRRATRKAAAYLALLAEAYGPLPARPFSEEPPLVGALTFDATGLAALARGDVRARSYLARAVGSVTRIIIPATTLIEPRMAAVAEAVAVGEIVDIDESIARSAARIMAESQLTLPLDALVVACAAREDSSGIVTADRAGMNNLVRAAARPQLHVFSL
jgi:predicted nucleic acid-binding protein